MHGSMKVQPVAHLPGAPRVQYGQDNDALARILKEHEAISPIVELVEVFMRNAAKVTRQVLTDADTLDAHLSRVVPQDQVLRVLSISQISADVIQLLGCKYNMDYELWTNRVQSSDREWFAGPLQERGATDFSHFNLACVDFQRATIKSPKEWLENRKLSHTVRLVRLLDLEIGSTDLPRMFVMRRISGHLRRDGNLWTFLYFNDPYVDLSAANYVPDIPGGVQGSPETWMTTYLNENTPVELLEDLRNDGFGMVLHVLREVKSTWKLLLSHMESLLEIMTEESTNEELMDTAQWLHRRFLLHLDTFQHHILYHRRYVNYLTKFGSQRETFISPENFKLALVQEGDALGVVDHRLSALRERTTAVLETILNLNTIQQGKLAAEMTRLQREDARIAISQGETLKRLTLLNMVYLPPTFVATLFSMNNAQYHDGTAWPLKTYIAMALAFLTLTMLFVIWQWRIRPRNTFNGELDTQHLQSGDSTSRPTEKDLGSKFLFRRKRASKESADLP